MRWEVILGGFGGQGILSAGQILAYAGMAQDLHVTYFPSYGGEVRGGTANCTVVLSDKKIASPVATHPLSTIVRNSPSLQRFGPMVRPMGHVFVNSSLVNETLDRKDVESYYIPANDLARELGDERMVTLVMLGAYIQKTQVVTSDSMDEALERVFSGERKYLAVLNGKAVLAGGNAISV